MILHPKALFCISFINLMTNNTHMNIAINTLGTSSLKVGTGRYAVNLIKELQLISKKTNYFIFVNDLNKDYYKSNKNFKLINVGRFGSNNFFRIFWEQFILPFKLKKLSISVLHSLGFVSPIIKTTKQIVTIHDTTFFTHSEHHTLLKRIYYKFIIPLCARKADLISADSENTKQDIIKLFKIDANKIKTIHLGVEEIFKKQVNNSVLKKHNINKDYILFVGMIEPRKNIPNLIKAFSQIRKDLQLVIVGKKGWHYEEIFKLVEDSDLKQRIIFTGYVSDEELVHIYSSAKVFVYPSFYEGFGLPVLEAMACECPAITANISSMKEIAENAAILINPNSVKDIKNAVEKILSNTTLRNELIKKGLKRAKEFTWKNTAKKSLECYEFLNQ